MKIADWLIGLLGGYTQSDWDEKVSILKMDLSVEKEKYRSEAQKLVPKLKALEESYHVGSYFVSQLGKEQSLDFTKKEIARCIGLDMLDFGMIKFDIDMIDDDGMEVTGWVNVEEKQEDSASEAGEA